MAIPLPTNTLCDIYRFGNSPFNPPNVSAVRCYFKPDFIGGQEHGDRGGATGIWTHIMLVAPNVDIRDAYTGAFSFTTQDTVYIPDLNATGYKVVFIERIGKGTAADHKKVYLDRLQPTWPSNEL